MIAKAENTPDTSVARAVGEQGEVAVRPMGHWMYCRKCRNPEIQDGIIIPEKSVDNTTWVEILALGPNCGQKRRLTRKTERNRQDMAKWLNNPLKVGDLVRCPHNHPWGIMRSNVNEWEFFVDECVPDVVLRS